MFDLLLAVPWGRIGELSFNALGQIVAWSLIGIGFVGTFLPFLPGPTIIVAGALVHYLWLGPEDSVGLVTLGILGVLLLLSILVEYLASAMGAKWFGSTKWGMWGAIIGGIVGIFFGLVGLLIGPLIGAFIGEFLLARKRLVGSVKSTWGTLVGTAVGVLVKGALSVGMIVAIVLDLGNWFW